MTPSSSGLDKQHRVIIVYESISLDTGETLKGQLSKIRRLVRGARKQAEVPISVGVLVQIAGGYRCDRRLTGERSKHGLYDLRSLGGSSTTRRRHLRGLERTRRTVIRTGYNRHEAGYNPT